MMKKGISLFFACMVLAASAYGASSVDGVRELSNDLSAQVTIEGDKVVIPAGTQVFELEKNVDAQGNEWVRLGLEFNDDSLNLPQDVWVSEKDYLSVDLLEVDDQDPFDENGFDIDSLSSFARKKMTYCYRYVKLYLLEHGMVNEYLAGASAYMAADILPKYGFKKTTRKPSNAIVNDVCVYKGGPSGHGHIEVMTSQGWYYGYGYKKSPIQNRTFIGCYHK